MPSQKQEFLFPGQTTDQLLQIAYGTFLELGWTPKYAGPNAIIGYTPRNWKKYDDEILVEATDGAMAVTSSLVHNESFDLTGKNKKHIDEFMTAFEKVKASPLQAKWAEEIEALRKQTVETAQEQAKQAEEIDKTMNLSGSKLYITYGIMAINVLVFILMALNGAGIFEANGLVHIKWGSNYTPLTLSGDWWRVITCMFIHFGIIHLALNTYALYMAGVYLEPMLGKTKYLLAYLCTGVIASLVSLWWHKDGVNSAGASGAIFGLYGVFLALLLTNLIPKQVRRGLLQSIGIFVVFNIFYGMRAGIDNAAHIGGLISGIMIGFMLYPVLKKQEKGMKSNFTMMAIAAITIIIAWWYLNNPGNKVDEQSRKNALNMLREAEFPDSDKFFDMYKEFAEVDQKIVGMFNDGTATYPEWLTKNESNINKEFEKATNIITNMKRYNVSATTKTKIDLLEQLLNARKEEVLIIQQLAKEDNAPNQLRRAEIREKQNEILNKLNS